MAEITQRSASASVQNGALALSWQDGGRQIFHPLWLRERLPVEDILDRRTGQRLIEAAELPLDLKIVEAALQRMAKGAVTKRPVLSSWSAVLDYCRMTMAFAEREQFRLLFLDKKNAVIADEVQQTGTVDHTPVYPREVVRRALELSASAIILVHNHPSGDPTPSGADVKMTRDVISVLDPLGIVVHDHIILGRGGHASLKGLKLI